MGHPWSESAKAFLLFQLRQTVNFWRLGLSASFSLDVRADRGADLVTKFHLPQPSDHLPPPPHPNNVMTWSKPVLMTSKTIGIPHLFSYGVLKPTSQVSRPPAPLILKPSSKSSPPSKRRRDYLRAVIHHARLSAHNQASASRHPWSSG